MHNKKYSNFNLAVLNDANMQDEPLAGFSGKDMTANGYPHASSADGDNSLDWTKVTTSLISAGGQIAAAAVHRPDITTVQSPQPAAPQTIVVPGAAQKSNTGTYIAIGVGAVLLAGLVAIIVMKK